MGMQRLLVVEDDATSRDALRTIFARRGWHVAVAGTVAEGLALLDPPPHCVILDLILPDGDGEAILRQVRSSRLGTRVAVCSGTADPSRLATVRALAPEALLCKPIDLGPVFHLCASAPSSPA